MLPGVVDEVPYNLLQVHFVEIHFQCTTLHIKVHGVFGFGVGEQEFLLEIEPEFHQIDYLSVEAIALVQAAHFFQHFIDALDIVVDDATQLGGHRIFVFLGQQAVGLADGGERVADFVRQIGRELAERGQFGGHGFHGHFLVGADKQHQQRFVFAHQRAGAHLHTLPAQLGMGDEVARRRALPAFHQNIEHFFVAVDFHIREIEAGLAVHQPDAAAGIHHHHGLGHMVEHQFVQAFETVEGAAVFVQGRGGAVEEGGIKRGEQCHQVAHCREHDGVDNRIAAGLAVGFKRPIV